MCLKIFTLPSEATSRIDLYKSHFEEVKEWLRMRYAGKTNLMALDILSTTVHVPREINNEITLLHVTTEYSRHPTLELYYEKLAQQKN